VDNDAVVAHTTIGAVSVIDGATLRVRHVIGGFDTPRYTVGRGGLAYVTDSGRGVVAVVDMEAGRILGRTTVYGPARHITISPSGRTLWVSLGSSARRIARLSLRDRRNPVLAGFLDPPLLAHDVGYEPTGRRVWVTSGDDHDKTVLVCDASGRVLRRLPGGATPQHVTFLGNLAYVSSGADGVLRVYSLLDGRLVRTTAIPLGSYNVQDGWGVVLTPSLTRGTLCVLSRGRIVKDRRVASSAHDACFVMAA
jgi:DNA-binding beta-propeller fold protein YncE